MVSTAEAWRFALATAARNSLRMIVDSQARRLVPGCQRCALARACASVSCTRSSASGFSRCQRRTARRKNAISFSNWRENSSRDAGGVG